MVMSTTSNKKEGTNEAGIPIPVAIRGEKADTSGRSYAKTPVFVLKIAERPWRRTIRGGSEFIHRFVTDRFRVGLERKDNTRVLVEYGNGKLVEMKFEDHKSALKFYLGIRPKKTLQGGF